MDRRTFVQATGAALAAAAQGRRGIARGIAGDTEAVGGSPHRVAISFLEPADVLICGSTLFACDLAIKAARAGKRATLVMERTNPFHEGIGCLRSWVEVDDPAGVPELLRKVVGDPNACETKHGRRYFNPSRAAIDIEDALCEAKVRFFYNAPPAVALGHGGRLCGVAFGGKTGLFAIESPVIVDCTPNATVARVAGAAFTPIQGTRRAHYVVELCGQVAPASAEFTAANGIQVRVDMHHLYACFDMILPRTASGPFAQAEDFREIYAAALDGSHVLSERRFRGADGWLTSGGDRLPSDAGRIAEFDNLLVYGPLAVADNPDGEILLTRPTALFTAFPQALEFVTREAAALPTPRPIYELLNRAIAAEAGVPADVRYGMRDPGYDEPGAEVADAVFNPPAAAIRVELAVAGGGTSGVAAAYQAATLGIQTVCLDRACELGGTNTVGGVTNLWYGRKTKAFESYYTAMNARNDGLNAPGFFQGLAASGVRILCNASLTGVAAADGRITRLYVVTPSGLAAVKASFVIDASGDGSVAAWGGAPFTFGCGRDESTLWASFANFTPGRPEARRPFLSPCDERSGLDTTRFILAMRRNSSLKGRHISPPFYIAPRENRHIRGDKTVTYLDALAGRKFADGVFRAESNFDIKGIAASDAAKAGFIPTYWRQVFQVTVPFAAMLPVSLDNVIVAGKAYSITHDALGMARMQRDLAIMGLVAAHAMKMAIDKRLSPRQLPVAELQATLMRQHIIAPDDIAEDDLGTDATPEELLKLVAAAPTLDDALEPSAKFLICNREEAAAAARAFTGPLTPALGRLLCFMGVAGGVDDQLTRVREILAEATLTTKLFEADKASPNEMPDQGYAPLAALMLGNLGRAGDRRVIPLLATMVEKLDADTREFRSLWGYTFALACVLERLPTPAAVPVLKKVLAARLFSGHVVTRDDDPRRCKNIRGERLGYLRLTLARALARCGDLQGTEELCGFLREARACYARSARAELKTVTGQDFGFDAAAWKQWLADHGAELVPKPLEDTFG